MTQEEAQEWRERLQAAVEETVRKRAARKAFRDDHTERRRHGKAAYHRSKLARSKEKMTMTDTTTTMQLPWIPTFVSMGAAEHCALCPSVLGFAALTLGAQDKGPVCEDCAETLPDIGRDLWKLAEALDSIDSAIWNMPQALRPTITQSLHGMLDNILKARIGPVTDEQKAEFVAAMAAEDKMLRLPEGRLVKAAEYDPEKHGPFLA